ncbi:lymphocyte function-associated antigen 3 isoform X2 [Dasypus novemcinctus]|uniref:lymphocyte function-associated antigen 3 isoform X2 n=1 Tax=Dasypus novemcinctus TaxID=9361 RepID=UPI00265EEC2C|nr:lymphocyte function-associated antigen 3 isoform X2 [Dasypus novemcinctus]
MAAGRVPRRLPGALGVLCLLLRLGLISCDSLKLFGAVNKNITLRPPSHTPFKEILWKKQKDKVVEWEENLNITYFPPFQDRLHLDTGSGNLTIFNLTSSDEDNYEIESQSVTNNVIYSLYVVETLSPLELNCTLVNESIVVQCGLQRQPNIHPELTKYSWNCPFVNCENNSKTEMYFMKEDDLSKEVQCIVENPVSKSESSIVLASCAPKSHLRHRLLIIVAAVATVVVILLFAKGVQKSG